MPNLYGLSDIARYMTLSSAEIEAALLPEDLKVKLPRYPVPALRIAKLAVDENAKAYTKR